jgi:hypothetical protein
MNLILRIFRLLSNVSRRWMIKQRKTGAGLLRIAFGSLTAILYALHLNQRALLWGPDGVISWGDQAMMQARNQGWILYRCFPSAAGAEFLYWAGLIVSLMFTLGLFSRVSSILFYVFTWSLYQRNWYAIDGGENLLIILAFYLMFADLSALSLDEIIFGSAAPGRVTGSRECCTTLP